MSEQGRGPLGGGVQEGGGRGARGGTASSFRALGLSWGPHEGAERVRPLPGMKGRLQGSKDFLAEPRSATK